MSDQRLSLPKWILDWKGWIPILPRMVCLLVIELTLAVTGSPPGVNSRLSCVSIADQPCPSIAAFRCPTGACLTHCRQIRAVEGGMDPTEAETKSKSGELVGMGCEAHESKFSARQERQSLKRKAFGEAKKLRKVRKVESKAILREQAEIKEQRDAEEEEALSNGIQA